MSNGKGAPHGGGNRQPSKYQQQLKGKQGQSSIRLQGQTQRAGFGRRENTDRATQRREGDEIDSKFGFDRLKEGPERLGWLLNYLPITMPDETGMEKSAVDLYFLDKEGGNFKATVFYEPYFYVDIKDHRRTLEIAQALQKRFEGCRVEQAELEDLDMPNHLSGKRHKFLKLIFGTVSELMDVKSTLRPILAQNQKRDAVEDYFDDDDFGAVSGGAGQLKASADPLEFICDMREHDVPYTVRTSIDLDLRVGAWYMVRPNQGSEACSVEWQQEMLELCEPRILAFDIECEKAPLKFPNAENDRIFMISYMTAGQGYLIINREVVSEDIDDFEYTPLQKYPGPFIVMNEKNEEALLRRFLTHVQELRPHVIVTYNGDFFDWPYVESRCGKYSGLSLYKHFGIKGTVGREGVEGEYTGRCLVHLDAFCWVKRDSYLPQGNQGLKAVTRSKLGYDPIEVDPEDMVKFAREKPHYMASYSVSDAVATYYLYTTYVHNFIFSLSTIIPMGPEDVLRKGSGTLCEALLMVEAYKGNIVCPNKQSDPLESFHEGHLLESETYIGGHVECLEAGVFRADIPAKFNLVPSALQQLIDNIDRDLCFALEVEHGIQRTDVANYDEVRQDIVSRLEMLRDSPNRDEPAIIYHLDVGAMYPNIILTNRLQPSAMVSQAECAACVFNKAENNCKRPMTWMWRGDYIPAGQAEYQAVRRQLSYERTEDGRPFSELSEKDQAQKVKQRLKIYSNNVYKKSKVTQEVERTDTVCMRENAFYVNTVRAFRDRRYDYKLLTKQWKGKKTEAEKRGDAMARKIAEDKEVLMDSLQLAHKCILNSFYGYVMRKGARWRSMEMAGIVTYTGAHLIMQARELVEQVGRPLELDTDGIWCILPQSFPQDFKFKLKNDKGKVPLGYPCAMLNADVHDRYTNHQYQDLSGAVTTRQYSTHSECSIFFELDGPYRAMVLPASPEEGKLLKKKYVVFNFNGTIAELKGFELKRRGELELVKSFQSQVFDQFLKGKTLEECYQAVGAVGNYWLDIIDSHGEDMDDDELMELISERKTISKTVDDYEGRKATSLTTAGRLADFLGAEMVKDKGLNCNLIISHLPAGAPVTERAIPVAIFSAEPAVKKYYLRKWMKDPSLDCEDFRDVVDWNYYRDRLSKTIQKIVTIPAGMQRVSNPCPRVEHPIWLQRSLDEKATGLKQTKLTAMFSKAPKLIANAAETNAHTSGAAAGGGGGSATATTSTPSKPNPAAEKAIKDLEDLGLAQSPLRSAKVPVAHYRKRPASGVMSPTRSPSANLGITASPAPTVIAVSLFGGDDSANDASKKGTSASATGAASGGIVGGAVNTPPAAATARPPAPMMTVKPANPEEFSTWLNARKEGWRVVRRARRRERGELLGIVGGGGGGGRGGGGGAKEAEQEQLALSRKKIMGVADFVRNASLAASYGHWQVLELQLTDTPGEFIVWAMTAKAQLQRLRMTVPRTMFVNCRGRNAEEAAQELNGYRVNRDLPHARPCNALYEVQIPEKSFLRNEKALALFLCDPQVEGVYETQTPLWLRAVLKIGCVAKPSSSSQQQARDNSGGARVFKLQELDFVSTAAHPYLMPNTAVFRRLFIYCTADKSRNSGLGSVGFFIIDGTNAEDAAVTAGGDEKKPLSGKAFVWLVNGGIMNMDSRPPFQRIYRKFQPDERGQVKFTVSFASSVEDALRKCGERLSAYVRERHGPTLAVVQGSADGLLGFDPRHWRKALPALQELPVCTMPPNSTDDMFPAVGWQMFAAERMVQRFLIFPRWMEDRLDCARYAHIPICNLGADALTTMIDVIFARILQHNRHLLWASDSGMPDLGGAEVDHLGVWSDALAEPIINDPGVYRSVCVELDIFGLAVCAIMSSGLLDAEGLSAVSVARSNAGMGGGAFGQGGFEEGGGGGAAAAAATSSASISSDASVARAFNLLKAITTKWLDDVQQRGDPISDSIITALYRYLCGYGNALLRDPALHRVVYGLMVKLFRRIVSALKKLGTKVVYADFSRVIIHTDKTDLASAREYVDFIVAAFGSREMFANLSVNSKTFWEQLVWMGPDNWSGILLKEGEEEVGVSAVHDLDGELEKEGDEDDDNDDDQAARNREEEEDDDGADGDDGKQNSKNVGKSTKYDFLDHLLQGTDKKKGRVGVNPGRDPADEYEDEYVDDEGEGDHIDRGEVNYESEYYDDDEEREARGEAAAAAAAAVADPLLQSHWTISRYLPAAATEYFNFVVGEYMYLHRNRRRALEAARAKRLELIHSNPTQAQQEDEDEGVEPVPLEDDAILEVTNDYMRQIIKHQLADRLLKLVDELVTAFGTGAAGRSADLGSGNPSTSELTLNQPLNNPALEFVKFTTHIMGLDPSLSNDVASLKRLLLAQLKVREFSEESQFRDPSLSYVLRDVICSYCSSCRDLDLLRDESVTHTEKTRRWRCVHCGNAINTEEVENRLLDEAERLSTTFLLQDMRCPQTHAVSTRLCATTSVLCQKLAMDLPVQKLEEQYSVLMKVARFHEFAWLEKTLSELSGGSL